MNCRSYSAEGKKNESQEYVLAPERLRGEKRSKKRGKSERIRTAS